jgi:hypothetical protein
MEVDHLVGQRGAGVEEDYHHRGLAVGRFQATRVLGGHLGALAGELQQPVLVRRLFQPPGRPSSRCSSCATRSTLPSRVLFELLSCSSSSCAPSLWHAIVLHTDDTLA